MRNWAKAIVIADGHKVIGFKDQQGIFYLMVPDDIDRFYQELGDRVKSGA